VAFGFNKSVISIKKEGYSFKFVHLCIFLFISSVIRLSVLFNFLSYLYHAIRAFTLSLVHVKGAHKHPRQPGFERSTRIFDLVLLFW